jgi:hypothetical protein
LRLRLWKLLTGSTLVVQDIAFSVGPIGKSDIGLAFKSVDEITIGTCRAILVMELGGEGIREAVAMIVCLREINQQPFIAVSTSPSLREAGISSFLK